MSGGGRGGVEGAGVRGGGRGEEEGARVSEWRGPG